MQFQQINPLWTVWGRGNFSNFKRKLKERRWVHFCFKKYQITVTIKDLRTTKAESNRVTSLNFPFYLISSRSYQKKSFPYEEYLWDAYHLHQLFYISLHIPWMPFIWRSANASQTSLICLKQSEKVSENILCVFMVAPSTRWSSFITSSLSHAELRQQENWKFKGMLGLWLSHKAALTLQSCIFTN